MSNNFFSSIINLVKQSCHPNLIQIMLINYFNQLINNSLTFSISPSKSFWFSDQQMSDQIIVKHAVLRKLLSKQLSSLCFIYLRNNNTELVNRLIQIFLQFNMMKQVEILLKILLDFECEYFCFVTNFFLCDLQKKKTSGIE